MSAFSFVRGRSGGTSFRLGQLEMNGTIQTMAQQVAEAVREFQQQQTGQAPRSVTVVLSDNTLFVTLSDALSPAEIALAQTPKGAAQVQEFHQRLFEASAAALKKEIRRITGVEVRESAVEVETTTGTVVHAFASGTMIQVFRLAGEISSDAWNSSIES